MSSSQECLLPSVLAVFFGMWLCVAAGPINENLQSPGYDHRTGDTMWSSHTSLQDRHPVLRHGQSIVDLQSVLGPMKVFERRRLMLMPETGKLAGLAQDKTKGIPGSFRLFLQEWSLALQSSDMRMFDRLLSTAGHKIQFLLEKFPHSLFQDLEYISKEMGQELIELAGDPNLQVTPEGGRLIHLAVFEDSLTFTDLLIESGADVNAYTHHGLSPLHIAAHAEAPDMIQLLIKFLPNVNARDDEGRTALFIAAQSGRAQHVDLLLKAGADCQIADRDKITPLIAAVANHHHVVVSHLLGFCLDAGVNLAARKGVTPLHEAVGKKDMAMLSLLLDAGANPRQPDSDGRSPYDWAWKSGWMRAADILSKVSVNFAYRQK